MQIKANQVFLVVNDGRYCSHLILKQHVTYLEGARLLIAARGYRFEPEVKAVKNNRKLQIQASLP